MEEKTESPAKKFSRWWNKHGYSCWSGLGLIEAAGVMYTCLFQPEESARLVPLIFNIMLIFLILMLREDKKPEIDEVKEIPLNDK